MSITGRASHSTAIFDEPKLEDEHDIIQDGVWRKISKGLKVVINNLKIRPQDFPKDIWLLLNDAEKVEVANADKAWRDSSNVPSLKDEGGDYVKFIKKYFHHRWDISNCKKYLVASPTRDEADGAVNTSALIAALLLTIPYSASGSLNYEYFDWLAEVFPLCEDSQLGMFNNADEVRDSFKKWLIVTMIPSIFVIFTAMLYYLSRPFEEHIFALWWHRGKFVLLAQVFSNVFAAYGVWFLLELFIENYMNSTDDFCEGLGDKYFYTAACVFWPFMVLSICLIA